MSFFDTTPIGRIINRFSKDMYTVDEQLVSSGRSYLTTMLSVFSAIFVVTSVSPMFLVGLGPVRIPPCRVRPSRIECVLSLSFFLLHYR